MKAIPLSPIDYIFIGAGSHPVTFAFAYKNTIEAAHLRSSLDETLKHFPLLRSKLIRISHDTCAFELADEGLSFETIHSPETFEDTQHVNQFVSPVASIEGEPLTRIKLTQTPGGSVLGVSISHALVDGFSYFHFLASWARVAREQPILEPSQQRELLIPEPADRHVPITAEDVLARCGLFWDAKRHDSADEPPREERLIISKNQMKELLKEAQTTSDIPFTTNDVVTAFLWKEYVPGWCEDNNDPGTYVTLPFDFRRVLRAVPRTFFGCALCFTTASIDCDSLGHAPLGELALLVRKAVGQARQDYILGSLRTLESLRRQRGLGAMEEIHVRHPRNGIAVTNISRLPIQGLDFGSGIPTGFEVYTQMPQGAAILPAQDGVEIRVFLPSSSKH